MKSICLLFLLCIPACAQDVDSIQKGDWNIAVFGTGGHSASGSETDGPIITSGLHFGKVLTREHGPGFLRGRFELGGEITPLNVFWQDGDPSYGFGVSPLLFKWHFTSSRRLVPYVELGGGMLWSTDGVPPGSANFNFTPQAAFGVQLLRSRKKAVSVFARYLHISNGGRVAPNPGINTVSVGVGFHWFR